MENLAFPFNITENGELEAVDYAESVKQSVKVILLTGKGERVMLPEFGVSLRRYLFEPLNQTVRELIRTEVTNALYEWENRIRDIEVGFADTETAGSLCVTVNYRVAGLNVNDNVQVTFNN
jgi:phage baseplate assembly protein W